MIRAVVGAVGGLLAVAAIGGVIAMSLPPAREPAPAPTVAAPALAPVSSEEVAVAATVPDPSWTASVAETTGIPERALTAYAAADLRIRSEGGCSVGWNTLAGIGWVESHHGTLHGGAIEADGVARPAIIGIPLNGENETMAIPDTDGGALDGDAVWDRAVGPLQFIPETWAIWGVDADGDGIADPHDIDDAALSAARYLCHGHGGLDRAEAWTQAIRSYNNTLDYQLQVAEAASRYASAG